MASEVDIYNLALGHLGDEANISDPDEASVQADHCRRYYPIARDALLEMHDWGFATVRATLALLSDDTGTAWAYCYAVPASFVKAVAVLMPDAEDTDGRLYDIETLPTGEKVIYTNVEDAILRYVKRVTDTTKFTPLFVVALSRQLAAHLAGPIIKGSEGISVANAQNQAFTAAFATAVGRDANGGRTEHRPTPSSISARYTDACGAVPRNYRNTY